MLGLTGPAAAMGLSGSATEATPAKSTNAQYAAVQCMTDEGSGRMRPCSSFYKKSNPDWRASDACFTDEGGGRKRPCSANYKAKYKK
jgi:hypothetical protein